MTTLQAIDITGTQDHEPEALKELNDFLARPNSIGIDNLKESLRNMVQVIMEIIGHSTGLTLHHLVHGEHSSLAPAGVLKGDEEKRKKLEELQHIMNQIDRMIFMEFDRLFTHVQNRIQVIEDNIESRIEKLDETIEDAIEDGLDKKVIEKKKQKRGRLKQFLARVKVREKQLQEVETTEEIIEVEESLSNDIADLRNGEPEPQPIKPSSFAMISDMLRSRRAATTQEADLDVDDAKADKVPTAWSKETAEVPYWETKKYWEAKRYSFGKNDDGDQSTTSGSGDSDDSDQGSGEKEKSEDIEPPVVEL